MLKHFLANTLLLAIAGLIGPSPLRAQDTIRFIDQKTLKEATPVSGTIVEESPARVVYKSTGAANKEVAARDIIDVIYDLPASAKLSYRSALADDRKTADLSSREEDRKTAFHDALKGYEEILPRLAMERSRFAERHVHFKIARLWARQAQEDPARVETAVAALTQFAKNYPDSWQISHCAELLAQLQPDGGESSAAYRTYQELAASLSSAEDLRQDCECHMVELLIRGKQLAAAERKLQGILKNLPPRAPQAMRVSVYQAECAAAAGKLAEAVARLETIVAGSADKELKALAYNALGDCYRLNDRPKEAVWPYLWVDVIYHQDRHEHAKAMAELAKLFQGQGDTVRAKEYREKLLRQGW